MTVSPAAAQAASMAFSVAPTLGNGSRMRRPFRSCAQQTMSPPRSVTSAPSARSASRCRFTGRGPSSHPPGMDRLAVPKRVRIAPRKMTEERSSRMRSCGMKSRFMPRESMRTVSPSRSAVQPRWRRMRSVIVTSFRSGTLCRTVSLPASTDAAIIGSTAFLAPCTWVLPVSLFPP